MDRVHKDPTLAVNQLGSNPAQPDARPLSTEVPTSPMGPRRAHAFLPIIARVDDAVRAVIWVPRASSNYGAS